MPGDDYADGRVKEPQNIRFKVFELAFEGLWYQQAGTWSLIKMSSLLRESMTAWESLSSFYGF